MDRNIEKAEYIAASSLPVVFLEAEVCRCSTDEYSPPWCQAVDVICLSNSGAEGQADCLQ